MEQMILAWVFTGLLPVLLITCVLAARGAVPLNHWVGVRIPAVMRSDTTWRAGHAAGIVPAIVASLVALVCTACGAFVPALYWGSVVAFVGGVVWVMIAATRGANAV